MEYYFRENGEIFPDKKEVARYLGYKGNVFPDEKTAALINECVCEMQEVLRPALVFEKFSLKIDEGNRRIFFGNVNDSPEKEFASEEKNTSDAEFDSEGKIFSDAEFASDGKISSGAEFDSDGKIFSDAEFDSVFSIESADLCKNLENCRQVVVFASTIGSQVDFLIRKYQRFDSVKAGIMQATGAMFIESFVDAFNDSVKKMYLTKPRFSPGYGDVKLEEQKLFFKFLDTKKIGLTLMDTMIMAPEKSVTAFIGILGKNNEK